MATMCQILIGCSFLFIKIISCHDMNNNNNNKNNEHFVCILFTLDFCILYPQTIEK